MLDKLGVSEPRAFLQGRYPDGLALPLYFLSRAIVGQLDDAVAEAVTSGEHLDAMVRSAT
jgi:hypothetical protein